MRMQEWRFRYSVCFLLVIFVGSSIALGVPSEATTQPRMIGDREYPFQDRLFKTLSAREVGAKRNLADVAMEGGDYESTPAGETSLEESAPPIVLSINNRKNISVRGIKAIRTPGGRTWIGIVQETGESAMLMWWKDGRLTGFLAYKGRVYTVTNIDGEIQAIIEAPAWKTPSGHTPASLEHSADLGRRVAARSSAAIKQQVPSSAVSPDVTPFSDAERRALESKKVTIDLMLLYTTRATSRYIMTMTDLFRLAVEQTNESFRNSGLGNISLRLVHTQLLDYNETGAEHFEHLYRMVDGAGLFQQIHKLRDDKRADIVGMIVDDSSSCGLSTRVAADSEEAYFVVHHSCATITISVAHEIGHILGARHDRQVDASSSPFPFGHGYVNGIKWRDIMSYQESCNGCPRIPYWSNPRTMYMGEPTGTDTNDNARVILQQAERVSQFR